MTRTMSRRGGKPANGSPVRTRKRYCHFCTHKVAEVDYKDVTALERHVSEKGKIRSRRVTGACRRHQIQLAAAVKRARQMALLPYVAGVQDGSHSHRRRSRSRN